MADSLDDQLDDPLLTTQDLIAATRRPVLIERHRSVIEEMEESLSDMLISGDADNPRLKRVLAELEADSEQQRIVDTLDTLSNDDHYVTATLQQGLVEHCCLLRENDSVEVAVLQLHVIGVYRRIRKLIADQQGLVPELSDLRSLPAQRIARLVDPIPLEFGSPELADGLVITPLQTEKLMATIRRISRAESGDKVWRDENDPPSLPREVEEPLRELPESQREKAREQLIQDRIRSRFYRRVFLDYFDRDSIGEEEISAHLTVIHWLTSIEETPHLYPFMQGQTTEQKIFRLGQLLRKIIQLNEIYQRVAQASAHPTYREEFAKLDTRSRLRILGKHHYPALKVDQEFTVTTLLCPFAVLAAWVGEKVHTKDFVLPPDPKR